MYQPGNRFKFLTTIGVFASFIGSVFSAEETPDCYPRPHSDDAICYRVTESDIAPYVDSETFLRVNGTEKITSSSKYEIARPGGVIYSANGKYLAESFTEEGHPYFYFYAALAYFYSEQPVALGFLDEYKLDYIESISEYGVVRYRILDDECDEKTDKRCWRELKLVE